MNSDLRVGSRTGRTPGFLLRAKCYRQPEEHMKGIVIIGAILVILGLVGLATPVFTTSQTKNVATLGDLKVQATEQTPHSIPPLLSGGVMILGVVLVGAGLYRNR
jgi:hypothetical protein